MPETSTRRRTARRRDLLASAGWSLPVIAVVAAAPWAAASAR